MKSLECQICFHEFDEWRRRPRILSCGHTFCSICLKSLLESGKIACPNCKKYHEADNVENININFILESFLSPDDTSKSVEYDTGFKCKEHCYEQNFFCQTHTEWVCRDCIVIKHKPCSHSENCDNKNDCKVVTKTERLDLIKSAKIDELKIKSENYGTELSLHIKEYDKKLNSKLIHREGLQKRLKEFTEENDFEIEMLNKKLNYTKDILSNLHKHRNLAKLAQDEITKAHGRIAVEDSCRNVDKIITSACEWAKKEKCNIIEDKKYIADVEITLKEFESLKEKLCETESILSDSKNEIKDLECKNAEHRTTNDLLKNTLKGKEKENLKLQNKLEKAIEQLTVNDDNSDIIHAFNGRISELEKELDNSRKSRDLYMKKIERIENRHDSNVKNCEICSNSGKVVETKGLKDVRQHLLYRKDDIYLITKVFNENGISEEFYGQLKLFTYEMKNIVVVKAFKKFFSHGSLLLQCRPLISNLESAEFVYLDIGKVKIEERPTCPLISLVGNPLGRLYIKLTSSPRRNEQMIRLCSSLHSEKLEFCNFDMLRKDRPGELVTCKRYMKVTGKDSQGETTMERCEYLYEDIDKTFEVNPTELGNVFGFYHGSAGFSIITRDNYSHDTRWPLLGKVVSGLHILKEAVRDNDIETIGIHSHGIGFASPIPSDIGASLWS